MVQAFQANHIDPDVLPRLTADDLTALGSTSVGDRRKLLDAIAAFDRREPQLLRSRSPRRCGRSRPNAGS
jgi:hypothetical protein